MIFNKELTTSTLNEYVGKEIIVLVKESNKNIECRGILISFDLWLGLTLSMDGKTSILIFFGMGAVGIVKITTPDEKSLYSNVGILIFDLDRKKREVFDGIENKAEYYSNMRMYELQIINEERKRLFGEGNDISLQL